jgi:hypothetical protein
LRNDLRRALDPLRLGTYAESTKLAERMEQLNARVPRSSVFIVLSDLHDPSALGAIRHASQKHECIVIHTVDPAEVGSLRAGFFRGRESETGRAFLAHSRSRWDAGADDSGLKNDLIRCGADYLEVRTDRPFVAPLRHFLGSRGFQMRGTR